MSLNEGVVLLNVHEGLKYVLGCLYCANFKIDSAGLC